MIPGLKYRDLRIIDGTANTVLTDEICEYLGIEKMDVSVSNFADGEFYCRLNESVRGADCFLIQPTCKPANENLMRLLIMIDSLKRASAKRITAVIPYFGYARQEKKTHGREPITAKLVSNLITEAGASRVVSIDLHTWAIQGFFDIPFDHASAIPILAEYFKSKGFHNEDITVVSPDVGGVLRAREFAKSLNAPIAIIDKRRPRPNVAEVMNVVGKVKGKICILVDDIIDTAGTICKAAEVVMKKGAKAVFACCTHPVLSKDATVKIEKSPLEEVIVTNTIPLNKKTKKIRALTVAPLLGEIIDRIYNNISVSQLFK